MTRASLTGAERVLAALGKPAKRPRSSPPPAPRLRIKQALCSRDCGATVWLAYLPSGAQAPFDRAPAGYWVIVDGAAVQHGPQHPQNATRWHLHKCGGKT